VRFLEEDRVGDGVLLRDGDQMRPFPAAQEISAAARRVNSMR
jgi:hypothetical protein